MCLCEPEVRVKSHKLFAALLKTVYPVSDCSDRIQWPSRFPACHGFWWAPPPLLAGPGANVIGMENREGHVPSLGTLEGDNQEH